MSADVTRPWISDGELLLHIGVNKTGTSALQGAMALARPRLLEQGVCYPGRDPNHLNVIKSLLQKRRGWENGGKVPDASLWQDVAAELRAPRARKQMISAEYICGLQPQACRRIVEEIGRDRVKVVVTLRPIEQLLPSQWQQGVKGRWTEPYEQWLDKVMLGPASPPPTAERFWWRNDHSSLLERWVGFTSPGQVLAVVVDTSNRNMIYETFEDLLGVTRGTVVANPDTRTNRSLSAEEAELLRTLNEAMPTNIDYAFHQHVVRRNGIEKLVEGRRPGDLEHALHVPRHVAERMREIGARHVERIRELGIPVVGSLESMVPSTPLDDQSIERPAMVPIDVATIMLRGVLAASADMVQERDIRIDRLKAGVRTSSLSGRLRRRAGRAKQSVLRRLRGR